MELSGRWSHDTILPTAGTSTRAPNQDSPATSTAARQNQFFIATVGRLLKNDRDLLTQTASGKRCRRKIAIENRRLGQCICRFIVAAYNITNTIRSRVGTHISRTRAKTSQANGWTNRKTITLIESWTSCDPTRTKCTGCGRRIKPDCKSFGSL